MTEPEPSKPPPDLNHQEMSESDDTTPFEECRRRKRRHRSGESNSTVTPALYDLIVILKPTDPAKLVTKINPVKLSEFLDSVAPDGVLQIRPNPRLNLLALDTRNMESTKALLGVAFICGIPVQAYQPRSPDKAVGVIRGLPTDMSDNEILEAIPATVPVMNARRLGSSEVVQLIFQATKIPEYISVGYTRFKVTPYVGRPRQCTKCLRFGHIASTCQMSLRCGRCGKDHDKAACSADQPRCPNCKRAHESTSHRCPTFRTEAAISKYQAEHRIGYVPARVAVTGGTVKPHETRMEPTVQKHTSFLSGEPRTMPPLQQDTEVPVKDDVSFPPLSGHGVPTTVDKPPTHRRDSRKPDHIHKPQVESTGHGFGSAFSTILFVIRNVLQLIDLPFARSLVTILDTILPLTGLLAC